MAELPRLRILLVSCVFPPEPVVSARTSADLAAGMSSQGHSVTVITSFPSRPSGVRYAEYRKRFFEIRNEPEGYRLIRCFSTHSRKSSLFSRLAENISFGLFSSIIAILLSRPDVIYLNTWPIFATALLSLVAKFRRIPFILSVQDVYPESLVVQGRISITHPVMRLLKKIDVFIARNASYIILISEKFAGIYCRERCIDLSDLSVIPNWLDSQLIDMDADTASFRKRLGILKETFLLTYAGNIGAAAGVETVIKAMGECKDIPSVRLLVAGDGSQLANCKLVSRACCDGRVMFYNPWPPEETSLVLRSANLLVLPTQGEQSLASMPSKLIAYLMAGRPVIALAVLGSDTAHIIQEADCGWVIRPNQPNLLAEQIKCVYAMSKDALDRRGQAGRSYALRHLSREACVPRVIELVQAIGIRRNRYFAVS